MKCDLFMVCASLPLCPPSCASFPICLTSAVGELATCQNVPSSPIKSTRSKVFTYFNCPGFRTAVRVFKSGRSGSPQSHLNICQIFSNQRNERLHFRAMRSEGSHKSLTLRFNILECHKKMWVFFTTPFASRWKAFNFFTHLGEE